MTNKNNNFVGMQACPYCHECMGVLIQTHLRDIPTVSYTGPEPCANCKKKFKADGVVPVWEVTNPGKRNPDYTGRFAFFRRESVKNKDLIDMMEQVGFLICDTATMDSVAEHYKKMTN